MTEWRLFRGWSSEFLKSGVEKLADTPLNFDAAEEEMTAEQGWHHYHSEAVIARESQGDAYFARARVALEGYQFSHPAIVVAHFDPATPLLKRGILLEIKVLGLHYLCPAMVNQVRDERQVFGFRYDTLEGHIERGIEWFLLTKNEQGDIRFRIEARWQRGPMPNWWSHLGSIVLTRYYQRRWHRQAHRRMSLFAHYGATKPPRRDAVGLTHQGVNVTFTYHSKRRFFP